MSTTELQHILIGTAGHIDHGKTRLVGRLTNVDTDRLPEEKARGISIDLGFAHWSTDGFEFGVIDVPGHERFVKNMVAGATGVNLALLVVAADDGVMPQTREHLDVMQLLGIRTGVVAITKTDLVEPDYVDLVEEEVAELVAGTFLEGRTVVPVSSETGEGIDTLREKIIAATKGMDLSRPLPFFRMPIDRVFSIDGHGTIVTGSVLSGAVTSGETLELLPDGLNVRVRNVHNHGVGVDDSGARRRTAINVAGVKMSELRRGQELAVPGFLQPTTRVVAELRCLKSSPLVVKDRISLNLHLGTAEVHARIATKGNPLKPGQSGIAELRLASEVVATAGQRFILRRISPALTVAGGTILDPCVPAGARIRDLVEYGTALGADSARDRLSTILSSGDAIANEPMEAARRAGVAPEDLPELIEELRDAKKLIKIGRPERRIEIHVDRLDRLCRSILRTIQEEVDRHQPRRSLPRQTLATACQGLSRALVVEAAFDYLLTKGKLVTVGVNIGPADSQVKLTRKQSQLRDQILELIVAAGLTPPTTKELADQTGSKVDQVVPLLELCGEDGLLIKVSPQLFFSPQAMDDARTICRDLLAEIGTATLSQLREAWGVSRKFAVPLGEYFDAHGITKRDGDLRSAGELIAAPIGA